MSKTVLYIAMSLDGYIADTAGGVGWLAGDGSDPQNAGSYPDFIKTVGTVILGYTTYRQIVTELSPDEWMYSGKNSFVFTHRQELLAPPLAEDIVFTDEAPADLIRRLKAGGTGDIWICGGASIVNQLLDTDMIDWYCISVIPTILGEGIPLFGKYRTAKQLRLISTRHYNGIVDLVYERR